MRFYIIVIFVVGFITASLFSFMKNKDDDIKIGLLYSKTGVMSAEESSIAKMLYFGVDQINQNGGIGGKKVTIVEYDGKSDDKEFQKGARYLTSKNINYIFGCWTSSSRKIVKPIIEKNNALLFYPVQYEGIEASKNIVYLGSTPNQQLNPTVTFIKKNFGDKIYVVGSDYIYPRLSGVYLESLAKNIKLDIVGQSYHSLKCKDFSKVVEEIKKLKPDAIINTLNGKSNIAFFKQLYKNKIYSKDIPVFSMSLDENSLKSISTSIGNNPLNGHFATKSYFNSINTLENKKFKKQLLPYFKDKVLTNASYNIYLALKFWEKAMKNSIDQSAQNIVKHMASDSLNGLGGVVYINRTNLHMYKAMRIGKINDQNFDIVWKSNGMTHPEPYSNFEAKQFWDSKVNHFYKLWGNSWQAEYKGESK